MKLSKQERIGAIVVVILIVLAVGVFLFIKPNVETILETKKTLANKEQEYNDAVEKAAQKEPLRQSILDAYNNGKNMADRFYPELADYEADIKFREFLASCEANVLVEDLSVTPAGTESLTPTLYVTPEVEYALKDYVNQGSEQTEFDPGLIRQAAIAVLLGETQTIGATKVSFTLKATSLEDILKFADEVNNYNVTENGEKVRKSIELDTVKYTDARTVFEYDTRSTAIKKEAAKKAAEVFKDKTEFTLSGYKEDNNQSSGSDPADNNGSGSDNNGSSGNGNTNSSTSAPLDHFYFTMDCTITFYSIERMQNPTPILDEQDKDA